MATRYNINDFALANPIYVGGTVSFYTVSGGAKTTTLATLYAASTGSTTLANPRTLDSDGKFSVPVYVEVPVIATVSGLTVADHDTGIMGLAESAAATSASAAATSASAAATSAGNALTSENNAAASAADAAADAAAAVAAAVGVTVQGYDPDIPTVAASQVEMEAGTEAALRSMSPLRVAQAIAALGGGGVSLPRSYLAGCILSNNGTDATNDIDISAGACRDSTNAADITVAALIKRLDANWAAGTNQGMRYSGAAIANTTYGIWAVSKADGTQDIYAYPNSGAPSAATVLAALQAETGGASYLYVRRIGCILRASAAILPFKQRGDTFNLATPVLDVNNATPGTSSNTVALASVPLGVVVLALMNITKSVNRVYFRALTDVDMAPSTTVAPLGTVLSNTDQGGNPGSVFTDTSAQIAYRSDTNALVAAATLGWVDSRGRDD